MKFPELSQLRLLTVCVKVLGLIFDGKKRELGLVSFMEIVYEILKLRLGFLITQIGPL